VHPLTKDHWCMTCSIPDLDLNANFNLSQSCGKCRSNWPNYQLHYSPRRIHWPKIIDVWHVVSQIWDLNANVNLSVTNGRTDGRTGETLYPLPNFVGRGYKKWKTDVFLMFNMCVVHLWFIYMYKCNINVWSLFKAMVQCKLTVKLIC
jgi:hypothetical protein